MFIWGLAQLAGTLVILWQPALPHSGVLLLSFPIALAAFSSRRWRWLAAVWLGATLAWWHADRQLADRLVPALEGQVITISGRIDGLVEREGRRQRFLFLPDDALDEAGARVPVPKRVRLSLYDDLEIATGERWQWRVKLRRPRGFANPGGFDYERWLFAQRIGATGYVYRPDESTRRLAAAGYEWRAMVAAKVAQLVDGEGGHLLRGLATGDRTAITDRQWEVLRQTGTAHLMAISGLHIGLVAGFALAAAGLLRRWLLPMSGQHWPVLLAGGMALAYGMLAGFGLPVRRALLGISLVLLALGLRRKLAPGHAYGAALFGVLSIDPVAPLDTGFWLSFGAVAAIIYVVAGRRPAGTPLRQATRVQAALFLLMAPLLLIAFGQLPLVSPLANAIAIPLFGFVIVPGVIVALVLLPWPTAATALLAILGRLLELLMVVLTWLAAADPGVGLPVPPSAAVLLAVGVALLCLPRALPGRWLGLWLIVPVASLKFTSAPADPLTLHVLDVGQGLAAVVETRNHTLVYDAGPRFGAGSAAEMVVVPFLESRGRTPDRIVISHGDSDHAGGLDALRRRYPGTGVFGRIPELHVQDCAGLEWQWDDVRFRMLHPVPGSGGNDNNSSCVLQVQAGRYHLLLTGDIEAAAEARLVARHGRELQADIVLIPHHGSRTSSTAALVSATNAEIAIAGAGFGNRWGFPRRDVMQRWHESGATVYSTGEQGAISVVFTERGYDVLRFRQQRRLWREPPPGDSLSHLK